MSAVAGNSDHARVPLMLPPRARVPEHVGEPHEQRREQHVGATDDVCSGPDRWVSVVHQPESDECTHTSERVPGADAERTQVHVADALGDAEELLNLGSIDQDGPQGGNLRSGRAPREAAPPHLEARPVEQRGISASRRDHHQRERSRRSTQRRSGSVAGRQPPAGSPRLHRRGPRAPAARPLRQVSRGACARETGSTGKRLELLVIQPETSPEVAARAMLLATTPRNRSTPTQTLADATDDGHPDDPARREGPASSPMRDDDQGHDPYGDWEAEGGARPRPGSARTAPERLAHCWSNYD